MIYISGSLYSGVDLTGVYYYPNLNINNRFEIFNI